MRPFLAVVLLLWSSAATAAIPTSERDALVAFYQSTNGAAWSDRTNWLGAPGTECTWRGVECEETQSNVIGLNLDSNHLDGTLPSSLRNLTKARFLIFAGNDLRGPIPPEIGELTDLQAIYLQANHFTGNIPSSFASLKKLTYLGAYGNELSGKLPSHLASMLALEELYLSENQFDGTIPSELAQLTNLKVLELNTNRLTGNIPLALTTMTKLERLTLNDNQLTGLIPPQLGNLTALVTLRLGYNRLQGTFPSALGQLHALEELYLPVNELTGPIPDAIGDLAALVRLDLRENQFDQTLPGGLYRLANLEELLLSGNEFTGTVSPQIANLAKLQVFSLYDNHFHGSIPPELGNLAPLRSIELLSNDFTGTIPKDLSRLTNLTWLDIADNQLTGTIPPELGLLPNLEVLSLYGNSLEGTIPRQLGQLSKLRLLLLAANRLQGGIPDELRNLTKLEQFNVNENRLSGAIPSWIGEWTALTDLYLSFNEFSGPLPPGLSTLENLVALDLAVNELTGRFVDFTRMPHVAYITASFNHFSGPLPPSIGSLTNLSYMAMAANDFSGPIPPEIGGLVNVGYFDLAGNELEGAIPAEIGNLKKAYNISLDGNHLSGTIPKELGQLTELLTLGLSFNALKGPIPPEITAMTGLQDHGSHFAYNGLFANDANTRAFVNLKHEDGDFEATQTVMPTNVRLAETTDRSATLVWDPIRYEYYGGGYQVAASTTPNGPTVALATTSSKSLDRITVRNLQPATTYYFTVATVSHPISGQPNLITSDRTAAVQGSTKQRVIAPAEVVMTDPPNGMVQIDGQEVQGDSFTLTNFGDVATAITLERTESFFTIAPQQFSLAAGGSQVVTLHSLTQQPGTYYGYVTIDGQGVPEDLYAEVILLSSARPTGSVVATPLATRIELAGAAGSDEVGTAQFRNTGTARLTGIVVSDQPWVEVDPEPITIDPGQIGEVNFRIVRSKRPPSEGALTAELSLVYVNGASDARAISTQGATTSTAISISKVTIVDVTQPSIVTGKVPPLLPGEVPFFIPGLIASASQRTDLSLINGGGPSLISDLKLYFTGSSQTSIASLQPLGFAQSVNLVNVVGSVYGTTGGGTLQMRSANADGVSAGAKVTSVTDEGTYTGAIPVFRGDRSATPGQKIYLAGIQPGGDLIVQETGGNAGSVEISFLNATGGLFSTRTESIGAYGLLELSNAVPANAVTAIITGTSAVITAYARQHDGNGDTWSVVDWSRFYGYARTDTVRVPFADGRGGTPRRRAARHDAPARVTANATARRTTDLVLFNPTSSDVRATLQVIDTSGRVQERTVNVPALATVNVSDAASTAGSSVAHVVIVPGRSELVVTARTRDASGGSAVPVVAAAAGLRLGQSQVFSGLDDALSLRTGYGFAETGGGTAKVRARIIIGGASTLVSIVTERTFTLAAREQIFLPELVRSFAGEARDTLFNDLHGLVLEVEVIEGLGAIVPFVLATDVGTQDVSVVVQ